VSGRVVLVVSANSVTRALLTSLLQSGGDVVCAVDSIAKALVEEAVPDAVILEGAMVRASPDALERLRKAWGDRIGVVLADRAYSDERRGTEDMRAYGATAFLAIPPDLAALSNALRRAVGERTGSIPSSHEVAPPEGSESVSREDAEQLTRYIERLWSRIDTLDAYQLLRVPSNATQTEIRDAFRERALEFHPDRHSGLDEEGRERVYQIFKRVSWAFRKVGDATSRREYDATHTKQAG
jgi:CheY-like chemotaxis protein